MLAQVLPHVAQLPPQLTAQERTLACPSKTFCCGDCERVRRTSRSKSASPMVDERVFSFSITCTGKPPPASTLMHKGYLAQWQT